jgi:hypothetical protein
MSELDLKTAIAVREREDGLLEKDTFDLSTSRPVEEISMPKEPFRYRPPLTEEQKAQAVVEWSYRSKKQEVPMGLKADWVLTSEPAKLATTNILGAIATGGIIPFYNMAKGVADASSPNSDIGKMIFDSAYKGLAENQKVDNLGGAAAKAYPEVPWEITGSMGALAEVLMFMPGVVKGAGEFLSKDKQFAIALNNARQSPKWGDYVATVAKKADQPLEVVDQALYNKLWNIRGEADYFKILNTNLKTATGIDIFSEAGSIPITRAKVGQSVNFTDPKGLVKSGIIKEITGERAIIDLSGREVVATLSQLSLPEPQPTGEGKVVVSKTPISEINTTHVGKASTEADIEAIMKKIQNGEEIPPILISKSGYLQDGRHRLEAYRRLGYDEVPTIVGHDPSASGVIDKATGKQIPLELREYKGQKYKAELSTPTGQKPPVEPPKTAVSPEEPKQPIKINNLNLSKEGKVKLESTIESIRPKLEEVKGKPLTHEEVAEAAKTSDLLKGTISRKESLELEARLLRTRQHLAAMAEGQGISRDFIDNLIAVRAFSSDAGRVLGSLNIKADSDLYTIKTKIVNTLTDLGKSIDEIEQASRGVDFTDQKQVTELYRKFVKPSFWELLSEYRYINVLSSPKTHIVNIVSNALQVGGLAPATKLLSGVIDPITSKIWNKGERQHYTKEVPAYIRGAFASVGDAAQKAFDALKGKSFVERPDVKHIPTGSKMLKWGRWIPQALEAADVFFRTIAESGELEANLAKGISLEKAQEIAKKKAAYWVFRKALDPITLNKGKAVIPEQGVLLGAIDNLTSVIYTLRKLPVFGKIINWYALFVQTPMEIAKQGIEYSATGFGTIPGAKDKTEQTAKALLGTLITAIAGGILLNHDSTAEEPTGSKEKSLYRSTGRIPWAIRFGDTWVSVNRLGPIGYPIAMALSAKHYFTQNPQAVTDTQTQKAIKVIAGMGEYFSSQSYVESLGDLMDLAKNAPGAISKLAANIPSQVIPISSFQRWVNTYFIDPVFRKTEKGLSVESIVDNAKKSIVGMTKGLEPYTGPDEEPSKRNMPILNAISPVVFSKAKDEYENEYQSYLEKRREDLIDKKESGDEPNRRTRRRR